jgi:hypothetical protein
MSGVEPFLAGRSSRTKTSRRTSSLEAMRVIVRARYGPRWRTESSVAPHTSRVAFEVGPNAGASMHGLGDALSGASSRGWRRTTAGAVCVHLKYFSSVSRAVTGSLSAAEPAILMDESGESTSDAARSIG